MSLGLPGSFGTGTNPFLQTTNPGAGSPVSANPYGMVPSTSSSATPSFPANTGPYPSSTNLGPPPGTSLTNTGQVASSPFSFLQSMTPKDLGRLFNSLRSTYGDGMAHLIMDFLTSGAGFDQQAINNLLASLQPGIERGQESIMEQFSAMGNRFGSPAALGLGDFLSQVNLNEGQLITQMYEDSLNRFMDVMMGTAGTTAKRIADSPSFMDQLSSGFGLAGSIGSAIQSIGQSSDLPAWLDTAAAGAAAL